MLEADSLRSLRPGESATVIDVGGEGAAQRRLLDMGLVPGARVRCVGVSPGGDPRAYKLRGTVIALRGRDAAKIRITRGDGAGDREGRPYGEACRADCPQAAAEGETDCHSQCAHWLRNDSIEGSGDGAGDREGRPYDVPVILKSDSDEESPTSDIGDPSTPLRSAQRRREAPSPLGDDSIEGSGDGAVVVALAGNPNVGKSTLFNGLTHLRQHTGNWCGKTVEPAYGRCRSAAHEYLLADLPGTYSLFSRSPEEELARDFLRSGRARAAVVVCDATCLERNLMLAFQIMALCERVLICVNLLDEAARKGLTVDLEKLSERLGVPVVGLVAHDKKSRARFLTALDALVDGEDAGDREGRPYEEGEGDGDADAAALWRRAEAVCEGACGAADDRRDRRLDRFLTGRFWAWPLMLLGLLGLFWLTVRGANLPSEWLSALFSALEGRLSGVFLALGAPEWLRGLLVEGAFRVLGWVVAVMLPPMAIFFPLFTLLEDAGVLPRVAYNLDRPFQRCRACGKQSLCMAMGLGCNAAGVTGCRIIESERERLLAVLTNALVPCNGRFPALIALITLFWARGGLGAALCLTGLIVLSVAVTLGMTRLLSATALKGESAPFILELPPYRLPRVGKVLVRSLLDRTLFVLGRAAALAAPAGAVIWALAHIPAGQGSLLSACAAVLDPIGRTLGLDGAILLAFVLGLPANEIVLPLALMIYGAGGSLSGLGSLAQLAQALLAQGWTGWTAGAFMLFSLFHWPCSTTLWTVKKETGRWKWTVLAAVLPTAAGVAACLVLRLVRVVLGG